jgi:hypothetical protein
VGLPVGPESRHPDQQDTGVKQTLAEHQFLAASQYSFIVDAGFQFGNEQHSANRSANT